MTQRNNFNRYRRFAGDTLVIASHNRGKVAEISELLSAHVRNFPSVGELGLAEPEETGASFTDNALLKARTAAAGGLPALADDSGLVVPALGGAPGIHSARWAGPDRDFGRAMRRVEAELGGRDKAAYFVCALALGWPDGHVESVEGKVAGTLVFPPRGDRGFGYDPIFIPNGYDMSFGELDPAEKHRISHRAAAFRQLVARCFA